jgi:hypothetical protein
MFVSFPFCDTSGTYKSLSTQESPVLRHRSSQLLRQICISYWSLSLKNMSLVPSLLAPSCPHGAYYDITQQDFAFTHDLVLTACTSLRSQLFFFIQHSTVLKQNKLMHQKSEFINILMIPLMTKWHLFLGCKDAPHMQIHKHFSLP